MTSEVYRHVEGGGNMFLRKVGFNQTARGHILVIIAVNVWKSIWWLWPHVCRSTEDRLDM